MKTQRNSGQPTEGERRGRFRHGRRSYIMVVAILTLVLLAACGNQNTGGTLAKKKVSTPSPSEMATQETGITPVPRMPLLLPTPTPITLGPAPVLGIEGDPRVSYAGIPWVRLGYTTCGNGSLRDDVLKQTIQNYHEQNVHVLLTVCQWSSGPALFNPAPLNDAAQGWPDAVQCGNEQMKYAPPDTMYITPANFARFFDACKRLVHAVRPDIPVILGSLDPQVGGSYAQVDYLNAMQYAMNTSVHPGGHWSWRSEAVGMIDSWHNGYPNQSVNNLYSLFAFWAQQFGVDPGSGQLGKHIWVVEGTGCFKGCGIDPYSGYEVAVSHILTLIIDIRTAMGYHVPFFYFSGEDFWASGFYWPIGILDINRHPKPLRQDLWMGARQLSMSCSHGQAVVSNQEQLLAKLYAGCSLPGNYSGILAS